MFSAHGLTFTVEGNTNDYLGKGLSGAKLIIKKPAATIRCRKQHHRRKRLFVWSNRMDVFINGIAGERFAVRNSGATAVVEGVGDHGCEYMTGGKVVVLGKPKKLCRWYEWRYCLHLRS